jgi:hypothetical protein
MPELEYVVLADYVRQDGGTVHIMAAGIDTFTIPTDHLPAAVPVGLVARIAFSIRDRVGEEHDISLTFSLVGDEDSEEPALLTANQRILTPPRMPDVPEHWRTGANVISRFALPIPRHGNYRLRLAIDDDPRLSRMIDLRAIPPGQGAS